MRPSLILMAALAVPALLIGLALQHVSCLVAGACLQVALEFQLEGREQFATADFWRGAVGYGLGLWLGIQIGWWGVRFARRSRRSYPTSWRGVAFAGAVGVLVGLMLVYGVTATRWGVDLPWSRGEDASESSRHLALEWSGADHIPDTLEWWTMAAVPWLTALLLIFWVLKRRGVPVDMDDKEQR